MITVFVPLNDASQRVILLCYFVSSGSRCHTQYAVICCFSKPRTPGIVNHETRGSFVNNCFQKKQPFQQN